MADFKEERSTEERKAELSSMHRAPGQQYFLTQLLQHIFFLEFHIYP